MSYCRANHYPEGDEDYCDIYLYANCLTPTIVCMGCPMNGGQDAVFARRSDVIKHIEMHRARGDPAPYDLVLARLIQEIETKGDALQRGSTDDAP